MSSEVSRLWARVDKSGSCWLWLGHTRSGYGAIGVKRAGVWKSMQVHRLAYELTVGPIEHGLQLDHICRVRNCVNPDHLEPVTQTENVRRGISPTAINRRKNKCKHNHEFTPDNTYYRSDGTRQCIACQDRMTKAKAYRRKVARRQGRPLIADASDKDYARGSRHHSSKLTEDDVLAIREAYESKNASMKRLARMHGVTTTTISNIVNRINWTHIP